MSRSLRAGVPGRLLLMAIATALPVGCYLPDGISYRTQDLPDFADKSVRFRAVHYYRVIDVCEPPASGRITNIGNGRGDPSPLNPVTGDAQVLSDALYRFVLTGRASAFTNSISFESGIMQASRIDPFGQSLQYDDKKKSWSVQTDASLAHDQHKNEQLKQLELIDDALTKNSAEQSSIKAEIAAVKSDVGRDDASKAELIKVLNDRQLALVRAATDLDAKKLRVFNYLFGEQKPTAADEPGARGLIGKALKPVLKIDISDLNSDLQAEIKKQSVWSSLTAYHNALDAIPDEALTAKKAEALLNKYAADIDNKKDKDSAAAVAAIQAKVQEARMTLSGFQQHAASTCPPGLSRRKGFLILGPEGWRTFNPDERLILAMYKSGRPLTDTLNEMSTRISSAAITGDTSSAFMAELLRVEQADNQVPATVSEGCTGARQIASVMRALGAKPALANCDIKE